MYKDRYSEYLETIPQIITDCHKNGKRIVLGYTSNLDVLVKWEKKQIDNLMGQYPDVGQILNIKTVNTVGDFARILQYYTRHGYGGEVNIASEKVVQQLLEYFDVQYGLGGTCAQGAAALGSMGIPALVHLTDHSKEVLKILDYESIRAVKHGFPVSVSQCIQMDKKPLLHLIVQYDRGERIEFGGKSYRIPLSNRLIMGYDDVNKTLPLDEEFLNYCDEYADHICSYGISGFNTIDNMEILNAKMRQLIAHFQNVKKKNPHCCIYFESAHFINNEVREKLFSGFSGCWTLLGMNEEELENLARSSGKDFEPENLESVVRIMENVKRQYGCAGVVMHSKDYSIYCGEDSPDVDIEKGLTLGNLISGTRARIGRYGTYDDCKETLQYPLSKKGVLFANQTVDRKDEMKVVIVPSRYVDRPKTTIGLGDSFAAGMQICFLG